MLPPGLAEELGRSLAEELARSLEEELARGLEEELAGRMLYEGLGGYLGGWESWNGRYLGEVERGGVLEDADWLDAPLRAGGPRQRSSGVSQVDKWLDGGVAVCAEWMEWLGEIVGHSCAGRN